MPRELTSADQGQTIALQVGESIDLVLVENPSTGYGWELPPIDGLDVASTFRSAPGGGAGEVVGAPGTRVFTLTPTRAGTFALRLVHRRPWMPADPSDEVFAATLDCR